MTPEHACVEGPPRGSSMCMHKLMSMNVMDPEDLELSSTEIIEIPYMI